MESSFSQNANYLSFFFRTARSFKVYSPLKAFFPLSSYWLIPLARLLHFRSMSVLGQRAFGSWKIKRAIDGINPLRPGIKLQILLLCFHTFLQK